MQDKMWSSTSSEPGKGRELRVAMEKGSKGMKERGNDEGFKEEDMEGGGWLCTKLIVGKSWVWFKETLDDTKCKYGRYSHR